MLDLFFGVILVEQSAYDAAKGTRNGVQLQRTNSTLVIRSVDALTQIKVS